MKKYKSEILNVTSINELLYAKYGKIGSPKRNASEVKAQKFFVSKMLKEARNEAKQTQSQLAEKICTKKRLISRIENGMAI